MTAPALSQTLPLRDKTAIVTGASRGIGAAIAWDLASRGANVCITYVSERSSASAQELADKIRALPHKPAAYAIRADLSTLEGPSDIINSMRTATNGNLQIHILVNNAALEKVKALGDIDVEDYNQVFDLNVRGTILLTQAALPYLQPKGRIINISSVGAREGFPKLSLYAASKGALEALTRCWAAELGQNGTTVNAVNPGPVQSEMLDNIPAEIIEFQKKKTPIGNRLGTAEEVASVVGFLAGEDSGWISGQALSASGGYAMY
ncbi:dehydrogenase [Thozetella sp. PMI_491]|nr:dehydrogenase [Thozetella sp. PMI_491]